MPIGLLEPNDWNPNQQSPRVQEAERESIEAFGFIDPIFVRPHPAKEGVYQIIDGEHRWRTMTDLGRTEVPVIVRDLTDEQAKKLTVILNETRGDADMILLSSLLADLSSLDDFKVGLPYTDRELAKILALSEPPEEDEIGGAGDGEAEQEREPVEHEVVLTFAPDRYEDVRGWLTVVGKQHGKRSVSDVVYEALRVAAREATESRSAGRGGAGKARA